MSSFNPADAESGARVQASFARQAMMTTLGATLEMEGGTTFHFVTGGIAEALERARQAAGSKDVRLGGGVETIRQYLRAGLVDELHLAISPVLLGSGEHLLSGIDLLALGYRVAEHVASETATHVVLARHAGR